MAQLVLKTEILEKVRKDTGLFGEIGQCLPNIGVRGLLAMTYDNDPRLTQASVLQVLKKRLNKTETDLLMPAA